MEEELKLWEKEKELEREDELLVEGQNGPAQMEEELKL